MRGTPPQELEISLNKRHLLFRWISTIRCSTRQTLRVLCGRIRTSRRILRKTLRALRQAQRNLYLRSKTLHRIQHTARGKVGPQSTSLGRASLFTLAKSMFCKLLAIDSEEGFPCGSRYASLTETLKLSIVCKVRRTVRMRPAAVILQLTAMASTVTLFILDTQPTCRLARHMVSRGFRFNISIFPSP